MKAQTQWICDSCKKTIERPEDGWIEWKCKEKAPNFWEYDFIIVHHNGVSPRTCGCFYDQDEIFKSTGATVRSMLLKDWACPDGLMSLLAMIAYNRGDKDQIIELIKRLFFPGYEFARMHFDAAISDGVFEPNREPGYYLETDVAAVLAWLKNKNSQ